jgi:hypothetical protein
LREGGTASRDGEVYYGEGDDTSSVSKADSFSSRGSLLEKEALITKAFSSRRGGTASVTDEMNLRRDDTSSSRSRHFSSREAFGEDQSSGPF